MRLPLPAACAALLAACDLREFVERVGRRKYQGLELQAHFFDDETHGSVVPATISRGLRFIYAPPGAHR